MHTHSVHFAAALPQGKENSVQPALEQAEVCTMRLLSQALDCRPRSTWA